MDTFTQSSLVFPVIDQAPSGASMGTVVLLHGFPQGPQTWSEVGPILLDAGYRVITPTLRGYAETNRPVGARAYVLDELCADVAALIDAAADGPVHLVGHDWGAIIAWGVAERSAEKLRTVTGVSVPPTRSFLRAMRSPRQLKASWYVGMFSIPGLVEFAARSVRVRALLIAQLRKSGQTRERAMRDFQALHDSEGGLTAAVNYYRAFRYGGWKPAGKITSPALFVWSNGDTAVTSAATRLAASSVDGSYQGATLLGVSHWIPEEAPEELALLILEHIIGKERGSDA